MNVENILKVADAIEQHSILDLGFNMGCVDGPAHPWRPDMSGHKCGTVACIVGWARAIEAEKKKSFDLISYFDWPEDVDMSPLIMPQGWSRNIHTPAQAVRTLRHLAATGEVNWDLLEPATA